jgi:hypothetical protein
MNSMNTRHENVADLSALALDHVESAEALSELLHHHKPGSDEWRRISGRLGVVLKHASVYAHLALAASNSARAATTSLLSFEDVVREQESL